MVGDPPSTDIGREVPAAETRLSSLPVGPVTARSVTAPPGAVAFTGPVELSGHGSRAMPAATVARLPVYLRALQQLVDDGVDTVSSGDLAEAAGVSPAQLRKDLSLLGSYGTRGVGYDVALLRRRIGREVGSSHDWPVVILGVGNLGTALANYTGFTSRGFRVVALIDASPALVGRRVADLVIADLSELEAVLARTGAAIAVIATPAAAAQATVDRLVAHGVTSILNFAGAVLSVPDGVTVRTVDLGRELQILAYHEQRKSESVGAAEAVVGRADALALAAAGKGDR